MIKGRVGWDTGKMPEKIMAMATFHGTLLNQLHKNPSVVKRVTNAGAQIISKYFENYVDAVARIDSYRYHHIYEFDKVGDKSSRLFKSTIKNGTIIYSLLPATQPNRNGAFFQQKAFVMESGTPVVVQPTSANILAFEVDGEMVFTNRSVINQPGGPYVMNSFKGIFDEFFKSNMPEKALRELGFYKEIEDGIFNETKKVESKINAGKIRGTAIDAANAAYGIAGRIEGRANRL